MYSWNTWLLNALNGAGGSIRRKTWWWRTNTQHVWGDKQWRENFRINGATFHWIIHRLHPRLQCTKTYIHAPISVKELVAITMWWMANTLSYRLIREQFGVAQSTIAGIMVEVCRAMEAKLLHLVVRPGLVDKVSNTHRCHLQFDTT